MTSNLARAPDSADYLMFTIGQELLMYICTYMLRK